MGSAQIICAGNDYGTGPMPCGPPYLSPQWRELYRHALHEANRLGLKIGITLCSAGWVPVLAGRLVGSAEVSERFLYDFRKTAANCMADGHDKHFTELANKHGYYDVCNAEVLLTRLSVRDGRLADTELIDN